jgi:hypothetical protein
MSALIDQINRDFPFQVTLSLDEVVKGDLDYPPLAATLERSIDDDRRKRHASSGPAGNLRPALDLGCARPGGGHPLALTRRDDELAQALGPAIREIVGTQG